jgi:hypothetical protein
MTLNNKRHKLLEFLSNHKNNVKLKRTQSIGIGVSYEEIYKELNCKDVDLQLITAELYSSDEIGFFNAYNIVGLYATEKGVASFSNKKYRRLNNAFIKNSIKDLVQIIIPVLSLVITILVIINNDSKKTKEIKAIEQKLELIQKHINTPSTKKEIHQITPLQ